MIKLTTNKPLLLLIILSVVACFVYACVAAPVKEAEVLEAR
jgi:hypothetical protein